MLRKVEIIVSKHWYTHFDSTVVTVFLYLLFYISSHPFFHSSLHLSFWCFSKWVADIATPYSWTSRYRYHQIDRVKICVSTDEKTKTKNGPAILCFGDYVPGHFGLSPHEITQCFKTKCKLPMLRNLHSSSSWEIKISREEGDTPVEFLGHSRPALLSEILPHSWF